MCQCADRLKTTDSRLLGFPLETLRGLAHEQYISIQRDKTDCVGSDLAIYGWPTIQFSGPFFHLIGWRSGTDDLSSYALIVKNEEDIYLINDTKIVGQYTNSVIVLQEHRGKCLAVVLTLAKGLVRVNLRRNDIRRSLMTKDGLKLIESTHSWLNDYFKNN